MVFVQELPLLGRIFDEKNRNDSKCDVFLTTYF